MAVNTTIASLSQTVALNGPDGAVDPPSSLDDSLRYHGAFIAMLRDGAGFTSATANALIAALTAAAARTAIGFTAPVIDRAYGEYTANANLTTILPVDDTIPQSTEGTQIISVAFTPKSATSRIRLRFQGQVASNTASIGVAAAIFSSVSANALVAKNVSIASIDSNYMLVMETEYVPGTTGALTYSVRVGPASAATVRLNGITGARFFGGTSSATLEIEEIAA